MTKHTDGSYAYLTRSAIYPSVDLFLTPLPRLFPRPCRMAISPCWLRADHFSLSPAAAPPSRRAGCGLTCRNGAVVLRCLSGLVSGRLDSCDRPAAHHWPLPLCHSLAAIAPTAPSTHTLPLIPEPNYLSLAWPSAERQQLHSATTHDSWRATLGLWACPRDDDASS